MKQKLLSPALLLGSVILLSLSCQKDVSNQEQPQEEIATTIGTANNPTFNLEVILRGEDGRLGHIKFRQDVDPSKIIVLDTWVRDLEPNHQYYYKELLMQLMLLMAIVQVLAGLHLEKD